MTDTTDEEDKYEKILRESRERIADRNVVDIAEEQQQLVVFKLGREYFVFSGDEVRAILPTQEVLSLPGVSDIFLGIINVSGGIESVVDLGRVMGLPALDIDPLSRIMIVSNGEVSSGVLVSSVEDVSDYPRSAIQKVTTEPGPTVAKFASGQLEYEGGVAFHLDVRQLFTHIRDMQ
ncbi:MAG: chemotaxis protein CheW [Pseudomonadota bacterium]